MLVDSVSDDTPAEVTEPEVVDDEEKPPQQHESDSDEEPMVQDRPQRHKVPQSRLADYEVLSNAAMNRDEDLTHMTLLADVEPLIHIEAFKEKVWKAATKEEMNAIEKNKRWKLIVLLPTSVKWFFKVKLKPDGSVARHKARLEARGFFEKQGSTTLRCLHPLLEMKLLGW